MSETNVLELERVTKTYGTQPPVHALRGVSFTVRRGELVAIVGPSGSGKSTLLHILGTLDRPSDGTVRIDGEDVATLTDRRLAALRARSIGFVFQRFFLSEHTTVLENVADGLLYGGVGRAERRERAAEALVRVGLGDRAGFRPGTLSGGERQRVAIGRALLSRPALLLMDEPLSSLDAASKAELLPYLEQLHRGLRLPILYVSHDALEVARLADRVIRMEAGRLGPVAAHRAGEGADPLAMLSADQVRALARAALAAGLEVEQGSQS